MRTLLLSALFALGCGSSDDKVVTEDIDSSAVDSATSETVATDDTAVASETAADSATTDSATTDTPVADTPVDAPDFSKVNPIAGSPAVKKEKGGYSFTEGTSWNTAGGFLLFSDIPNSTIHKLVPPATVTEFRKPSGNSNGLTWDPMGRLIACEHGNRRVSRTNADGAVVSIADKFEGKDLNSPNDAIAKSDGNIYFTDPDYGLNGRARGVNFKGVYRIDPTGALTAIEKGMNQPNGVALSPDEKLLYVGDSGSPVVNRWDVAPDGSLTGKTKFASEGSDGIGMDDAGNVYLTGGGKIKVYKPDGTKWGELTIPEGPTNCAFGGADRKTLYISAQTSIYSVVLAIPGKP